jgi:hypothetical protein
VRGKPLSVVIFSEAAGEYPSIGDLNAKLVEIYDRHLHEIPGGFGVRRLMDAGAASGWIKRKSDRSFVVHDPTLSQAR